MQSNKVFTASEDGALDERLDELLDLLAWMRIETARRDPSNALGRLDSAEDSPVVRRIDDAMELVRRIAADIGDDDVSRRLESSPPV